MDEIVAYQLERARARPVAPWPRRSRSRRRWSACCAPSPSCTPGARSPSTLDLEPGLAFRGVEGDLLEVLGNLLDNAYKWCRTRVAVGGRREGGLLVLWVEDDGPGIPPGGARGPGARRPGGSRHPGHGIGLAVVREICRAYGGDLDIAASPLGGALVRVRLGA